MIKYLSIISNLKPNENHEKSSLTLSLSFWLHAERNGFYLGLNALEGSYIQEQGSIGERILAENALNQAIKTANGYPFYKQLVKDVEDAQNAFNKVKDSNKVAIQLKGNGGTGGILNEISFGYKYFLGKKRIIGFRHSLFFGYQFSGLALAPIVSLIAVSPLSLPVFSSISYSNIGSIAFLPYGFNTDLLINLIDDNERASQESGETLDANALERASRRVSRKYSLGFVIGMNIGGSTWLFPAATTIFATTIFQFQGKFGVRWNRDKYNAGRYLGGSSIELGVKVPAFGFNDNTFRRWVSVYFNYTYNFKNEN
ncbi:outer membrane protein [Helicobacter pylori]|uniref:outer membrane protein n=1 Tax=Helicobacter pylori TaxID=210 RepID=UPI000FDE9F8B|nr:outer membrane protein [Helicobacter pylori]RVY23343.1 outer membrane protein [Helicobacter pylori]